MCSDSIWFHEMPPRDRVFLVWGCDILSCLHNVIDEKRQFNELISEKRSRLSLMIAEASPRQISFRMVQPTSHSGYLNVCSAVITVVMSILLLVATQFCMVQRTKLLNCS